MYLFFENKKLKAVFDDEKEMKKTIAIYIIKFHISNNSYKSIEESKNKLRNKLADLFSNDLYFMENLNNTWSITEVEINKIKDKIEILNFNTRYTKIDVKGKNLTARDLAKNIPNINTTIYHN